MSDTEFEGIVESPWSGGASPFAINSKKLGMWLFIISDSLTFSALLISYAYVRLDTPNWPRPFEIWPAIAKSSFMTFVLLSSSLTMVLGVNAAHQRRPQESGALPDRHDRLRHCYSLLIHATEWVTLFQRGSHAVVEPLRGVPLFGGTFFGLTGLHMLHVTIGVVYLAHHLRGASKKGNGLPSTWKSAACTGTLSTWSGCLFSRWSIC